MYQAQQTTLEQVKVWECVWFDAKYDPLNRDKNEIKIEFKVGSAILETLLQLGHLEVFQTYLGETEDNILLTVKMDQDVLKTKFG